MADPTSGATVRVPDWLADELESEIKKYPRGQRPSRGDLLAGAWQAARAKDTQPQPPSDLTEDQLDVLAILAEDPSHGLLFQAVQTTVKHALEEYREKWKPKHRTKKTAGPVHHDRTGS